jgi:Na+/alanine symporter
MQEIAMQAWNPWIAWLVLGVGGVLLLATVVAPVRALPRAVAALRGRTVTEGNDGPLWLPLAAAAGMGGITGGVLAVAAGGAGALPWLWITTVLGMAIAFAEGSLGARARSDREPAVVHLLAAPALGKLLAPMYALAVIVLALVVGAAFQANQAAAVLHATHALPPTGVAIGLAVLAAPFVLVPRLRRPLLLAVPVAIVLYAGITLAVATRDAFTLSLLVGDAINQAFGVMPVAGGVAGGGVALAVAHGVLRGTLASQAGLGGTALLDLRARSRGAAGAVAMLVPLLAAGVLGSTSALLVLGGVPADEPVANPVARPLELSISRGLSPSQQVGQTIVLPLDTTLEPGEHYAMRMRANPRGHAMGARLVKDQNHVAMPHWVIAHATDTLVLRALGEERGKHAAWDVRIPCEREVKTTPDGSFEYLLLRPKDPSIQIGVLATKLELLSQPYVVLSDFDFPGRVGHATSPKFGEHIAMYEAPAADRPDNPSFHMFFRAENGAYRGPVAADDSPRPPSAFVASEGYEPEIGTVVDLRVVGDPRGDAVLHVTRSGGLEAPAWDTLLQATTIVVRHQTDPTKDLRLAVTPHYELFRVRLDVVDERYRDARSFAKLEGYEKTPYLVVPEYHFQAEVHGDARLPPELKGRRTLVPLHPLPEPQGHFGDGETYHPHPAELLAFGLHGPLPLAREGAEIVAARVTEGLGNGGRWALALVVVVLVLATVAAWAELGGRAATAVAGSLGGPVLKLAMLAAAAFGTTWTLPQLLPVVDLSLAAVLVPSLVGLVLLVPKIRQAARLQDDLDDGAA